VQYIEGKHPEATQDRTGDYFFYYHRNNETCRQKALHKSEAAVAE
jgi:hypothetical protein